MSLGATLECWVFASTERVWRAAGCAPGEGWVLHVLRECVCNVGRHVFSLTP